MRAAVVPCSGRKLEHTAPAGELYTGPLFRSAMLAAAALLELGQIDRILILSAKHGLVTPEDELAPYDVRMGAPGTVSARFVADQLHAMSDYEGVDELLPLLPKAYDEKLRRAVSCVNGERLAVAHAHRAARPELLELLDNPLEGSRGVLDQRGRLRRLREEPHPLTRLQARRELEKKLLPQEPQLGPRELVMPEDVHDGSCVGPCARCSFIRARRAGRTP